MPRNPTRGEALRACGPVWVAGAQKSVRPAWKCPSTQRPVSVVGMLLRRHSQRRAFCPQAWSIVPPRGGAPCADRGPKVPRELDGER